MPSRFADEEVRALAAAILEREPYAVWRRWDVEGWRQLLQVLERLLDGLERLRLESPVAFFLLFAGLVVVALALLAHVVWALRAALAEGPPDPQEPRGRARDPRRFDQEAGTLASQERFLEASHRLLLASIELLVRKEAIALAPRDPNRILRARVAAAPLPPALRSEFIELLDRLEVRWFRDRSEDAALYRRWRALHERLGRLPGGRG